MLISAYGSLYMKFSRRAYFSMLFVELQLLVKED